MRLLAVFAWTVILVCLGAAPGHAERRVALVIGNGAYSSAPRLPNPRNDADDVAAALKRNGFETIVGLDLDQLGMQDAAIRFSRAVRDADVAVFYYSGHALQFAGVNYLMPVDAKLTDESDLRRMTRVDEVVADLQQARNVRILVLDSCRDNPLAEELKRSIGLARAASLQRGLARIDAPQGMIVAYATQAGRTAADGTNRNSPYTTAFLKHIEAQDEIGTVFRRISADVYETTKHAQLPELSLSLIGEFYLHGKAQAAAPAAAVPTPPPAVSEAERAWAAGAKDTASIAVLDDFVRRYGDTFYGTLARARLEELRKSQAAAVAAPSPAPVPGPPPIAAPPHAPPVAVVVPSAVPPVPAGPCGGAVLASLSARAARTLSRAEECALKPKDVFKECDKCPEMVVVSAGQFTMGSPANEAGRSGDEGPQHPVTISKPFAVGRFAVTFDEWDACVANGGCNGHKPSDKGWGHDRWPVINVTWTDAKAYAAWLSRKTGKTYRLLTEAEREYVTRAGTTTSFWWGSSISDSQARYCLAGDFDSCSKGKTIAVDSFEPNAFGLYQVHGNVWDWVEDCYHDSYAGAPTDGSAWVSGDCNARVMRGGSWFNGASFIRAGKRYSYTASVPSDIISFRLTRTLSP